MANTFERNQYEQEVTEEATENSVVAADVVQETVDKAPQSDVAEVTRPLMDKEEERRIKQDRMRFVTNKLSRTLALVAILFNLVYFVSIYKSNNDFYYKLDMGISVLLNLIFMLAVFLCSEGVKNYNRKYSIALVVIGVLEGLRIFFWPLQASKATFTVMEDVNGVQTEVVKKVMEGSQLTLCIICLAGAAALLIASGVIGVIRSVRLAEYKKTLDEKPA